MCLHLALRNPTPFLADLSEQGWNIIALSLPSPCLSSCTSLSQATIGQRNNLIIIGSEGEGIPDDLLEVANQGVYLEAFNQGVAFEAATRGVAFEAATKEIDRDKLGKQHNDGLVHYKSIFLQL